MSTLLQQRFTSTQTYGTPVILVRYPGVLTAPPITQPHSQDRIEPGALLEELMAYRRWLEALELAVVRFPGRVPGIIASAGEEFWMRGVQKQLHTLLSQLQPQHRQDSEILQIALWTALGLGREREVLPEIEVFLADHEAPALRAGYAVACLQLGDLDRGLGEAARAVGTGETPLTLYACGLAQALSDPEAGVQTLERGMRLVELAHRPYWSAQFAAALADRHLELGHYRTAANWAEWGLQVYDRERFESAPLRVQLLHAWVRSRTALGQAGEMEEILRAEARSLDATPHSTALRTALADLLFSLDRREEALEMYGEVWRSLTRRDHLGSLATAYVHALLDAGRVSEAVGVAERAVEITSALHVIQRRQAVLAQGMALSWEAPIRGIPLLQGAMDDLAKPMLASGLALAAFYLTRAQLLTSARMEACGTIEAARAALDGMGEGGIRYLAGSRNEFRQVLALWKGERAPLELRFLGRAEARLHGEIVPLRLRFAEFLATLAMHPDGLNLEQLALAVYDEFGTASCCKTEISRLRRSFPVESKPYRLGVPVWADFIQVPALLQRGRLMEALSLYGGSLLPNSDAPQIRAVREHLEVALRNAVLASGNADALWGLAERLSDDLELWEETLAALDRGDPRRFMAEARVSALRAEWGIEVLERVSGG